ncbi:unnamed protein product [Prorocentrum cordatum]|uniref:tRNA(Phe) (4-demethylwyosine(37)-C(7)) aminocarboxypropyltransferase n=1 Tax=Prorocentrum cordatum TaxID=2364126 RepID=A0ABN9SKC4_9DINO|nr:unnamed protein product [Polarella glacialis]
MSESLLEAFRVRPELRKGIMRVELLSSSSGEGLACLTYAWPRSESFVHEELEPLLPQLAARGVVANARKQWLVAGEDRLVQVNTVASRQYPQILMPNTFSQSNLAVNAEMLKWAAEQTSPRACGNDLLELCCGNGNFTLPVSANFGRVLATEMDKVAIRNVAECSVWSGVTNVTCVRMSAAEVAQALRGDRTFRRLRDAGVDIKSMDFGTVLVNPPRAGLRREELEAISGIDRVVYISCAPRKLAKDLRRLPEHRVTTAALFDQFPFTSHAEVGVVLERG